MKRVLITGANSYIGTSFEKWISKWPDNYSVDTVDMIDGSWRDKDFSCFDVVFHVAGIAHSDISKVKEDKKDLYYKVNTDLTVETAKKAKHEGVKQFIFMSSAIVYGESAPIGEHKIITFDTIPSPANFYGDSKLKAEQGIIPLSDEVFRTVILRPPMIYGKGSKGNYPKLAKYAVKLPFFPNIYNKRSVLYVENLCEFVRLMIDNNESGIFHPQNAEYVSTSYIVKTIAQAHGKKIRLINAFKWCLMIIRSPLINKVFGSFIYDKALSDYKDNYRVFSFEESIAVTEG